MEISKCLAVHAKNRSEKGKINGAEPVRRYDGEGSCRMTHKDDSANGLNPGAISRRLFLQCSAAACLVMPRTLLGEENSQALFNGVSLDGWHKASKKTAHGSGGQWTVVNGVLEGEQDPPGSGNGGLLLTDQQFANFELRFEFLADWGVDSGLFVRCNEQGHGLQMYIDYHEGGNVGHLRGEMPGNFAMKPFQIFATLGPNGAPESFRTTPDTRAAKWPDKVYEHSCTPEEWVRPGK
jgi:hypothetical protein